MSDHNLDGKNGRMRELVRILAEASKAYYDEDREIMPNMEYDKLYDELAALESETGIVFAGSPTQRVGYEVSSELAKVAHAQPMLSLDKTKETDKLADWLGDKDGLLSWKLDGLTVALTYEGGELAGAVTRGDGSVGEVITNNAKQFDNLPLRIPYEGKLVLRGEAVIRYSDFEKINNEIEDEAAKYKNPRNLASGSVRQLDPSVTAGRYVRFYAFGLVSAENGRVQSGDSGVAQADDRSGQMSFIGKQVDGHDAASATLFGTRIAQMSFLAEQGFDIVEYHKVDAAGVATEVRCFAEKVEDSDLPSDGLVLIFDDIAYGESLGRTSKFPRDAIAFKWTDELAETKLLHIEWSASRTGLINPIAVFEPVEIEGTTVSRASVHNISIMEELALGAGDTMRIYKANMIIPQIAENLTQSGTEKPPARCPVCDTPTAEKDTNGVRTLHCPNPDCAAKKLKFFEHFCGRQAMNIEGLSELTLEKFVAAGFVHEPADIFRFSEHRDEIVEMDGFGEKSYENLVAATGYVASAVSRIKLLNGLGIPGIGRANARVICRAFGYDWQRIMDASVDELTEIDGIGSVLAEGYVAWWANEKNRAMVGDILSLVTFDENEGGGRSAAVRMDSGTANGAGGADDTPPPTESPIAGKTFVITGKLDTYANRDELKELIEDLGGKVTGSVSEKTDYLINNDIHSSSSKNKMAKKLGVKIITEDEINTML